MSHALTRTSCVLATAFFAAASSLGQTTTRASTQAASGTGTLIVLNKDGASASLRDRATGEEFARLDTGVGPHEVAVSPDGRIAVVDVHDRGSAKSARNQQGG